MDARPFLALSLAFCSVLGTASCGGSLKHVSDITPSVAGSLSRIWVLDEQASDDPAEAMAGARPGPEAAGPGQAGRGAGSGGNPEAARALGRLATVVPRRLEVSLSDSAVVVTYPHEEPWLLPFGEQVKRKLGEGVDVEAKAEWKDGLLSVTRKVSGAGSLKETFHPSSNGERLTVAVELTMGQRGGVAFRRVYQPDGASRGAPPR